MLVDGLPLPATPHPDPRPVVTKLVAGATTVLGPPVGTGMTRSAPQVFDADPLAYQEYLRTPLGRLRTELSWKLASTT